MSSEQPPPNPHYHRAYTCSISHGSSTLTIPSPGGNLPTGDDADDLIYFLELVIKQIRRAKDKQAAATPNPHAGEKES